MDHFRKNDHISNRQNITTALICLSGIALNLLLNAVVSALGLPLSLDTAGTIAVAAMGGYLPGIAVAFVTNIVNSLWLSAPVYYGALNVVIAVFAAFLARRGRLRSVKGIIEAILLFTLISGGIGSLISWFMDGPSADSPSGLFSPAASHILSGLLFGLLDKTITVLLAAGILRILPEKIYRNCFFNIWMQSPLSSEEMTRKDRRRSSIRVLSLRSKALLVIVFSLTTVVIAGLMISQAGHYRSVVNDRTVMAQQAARMAAAVMDGDHTDEYLEKGEEAEGYLSTKKMLEKILSSSSEISFLYVYKMEEDGCHVIFDIDTDLEPGLETGAVVPFEKGLEEYIPALLRGEEIDAVITNDSYGHLLTAYQPVYDSQGNCVCYVGTDVDLSVLDANERNYLVEALSVYLSFFILLSAFVIWLMDYHVIYPVKNMTESVNAFSFAGDSQQDLDEAVKKFRKIDIHTGDELEWLYHSLCQLTLNQTEQMRSIRRLSDSTVKMQDGLIITMADMVENRDSDTGAHIQKTAAYVKIIVEGLERKGYYAEKITPKFKSDVVRSAPLHDVGKINIPDEVLNKPGKLTDEEFEIMKTHTTAGEQIMEHVISTVEGDSYLKEARNMAAYHHERWDGRGYPQKLHGEVTPLSARIMAVADVFDALTSPRVYKPAFPLDKALAIIEEGKGTQFDPKCVEVFMDSLDEVKLVLKKYNQEVK